MSAAETTPIPVVQLTPAMVEDVDGVLAVNVNGTNPPVWWAAGYIPTAGDAVRVLLVDGTAIVVGPVILAARPLTGLAGSGSGGVVPITVGTDVYQGRYTGAAPVAGSIVRLDWQGTTPWAWPGAVIVPASDLPPPPPPKPPPPPIVETGRTYLTAIDSATWSVTYGSWSSYYGRDVVQGTYGGTTQTGSWFYGTAPAALKGRTVTAARLFVGARLRMGSYNSDLTLNVYRHTATKRPGSDVARVGSPTTYTLKPSNGRGWLTLPIAVAQAVIDNGGGLGIAGNPYGGIAGLGSDAASGQIEVTWKR